MRRVSLSKLTPDMRLGKAIYNNNNLLLGQGVTNINKYIKALLDLGITSVYVEDSISDGIEIPEIISEQTVTKCKTALQDTFKNFKQRGIVSSNSLESAITMVLEEIIERPDILVSLTDIGSTDDNTLSHSINVTIYSLLLANAMGYSKFEMSLLAEGTILHDIGKTVLDQDILFKPGPLTEAEFDHVKQHTTLGYEILKKNQYMPDVARIISLYHHERMDGSGYPSGLLGKDIHKYARIVAIADVYDALISNRCYRGAWPVVKAVHELYRESTDKLDSEMVGKFIGLLAVYPNGTMVHLSDGRMGLVKEQNSNMPFRPIVRIIKDAGGNDVEAYEVDLIEALHLTILDELIEVE